MFEVRDLVRTLPDRSQPLGAAGVKKLEAQVRVIDRLSDLVDRYADAGKGPETVRQHHALLKALATIGALYPKGALASTKSPTASVSDKERDLYLTPGGAYTQADVEANVEGEVTVDYQLSCYKAVGKTSQTRVANKRYRVTPPNVRALSLPLSGADECTVSVGAQLTTGGSNGRVKVAVVSG